MGPRLFVSSFKRLNSSFNVLSTTRTVTCAKACVIRPLRCFILLNTSIFTYPHKEKSKELMSGDRGGQAAGPPLPIQRSRNLSLSECTDLKSPVWRGTVQLKKHMSS